MIMKNRKEFNRYLKFALRFIAIFIVFQLIGNVTFYLKNKYFTTDNLNEMQKLTWSNTGQKDNSAEYIILSRNASEEGEVTAATLTYSKTKFHNLKRLNEISDEMLSGLKAVFLCEGEITSYGSREEIERLLRQGIAVVFLQLPNQQTMEQENLYEVLGIARETRSLRQRGIRFVSDFMLGGKQDYVNLELQLTSVKLGASCKTYAYGLEEQQKDSKIPNEALPPIIWRNHYLNGRVFVINGTLVNLSYGHGIITGLISQIEEDYIYPVINGFTLMVNHMPYCYNVNEEELLRRYSRDAMGFQQDILFPSMISVSKRHDIMPGFFMEKDMDIDPNSEPHRIMNYYLREINAMGGDIGVLTEDNASLEETRILTWEQYMQYNGKEPVIPITTQGFQLTEEERLAYYSGVTALGIITHRIDMNEILYPRDDSYDWVNVSLQLDSLIGSFREKFPIITSVNIRELVRRIKNYQTMDQDIQYSSDKIRIKISNLNGNGYFILRTSKKVKEISGGTFRLIEENAYMVKAEEQDILIHLSPN